LAIIIHTSTPAEAKLTSIRKEIKMMEFGLNLMILVSEISRLKTLNLNVSEVEEVMDRIQMICLDSAKGIILKMHTY
jgi:hypothetical protein